MPRPLDLLIIGGGPAGLSAGLYAARAGLKTTLLEKAAPGGQIINTHWVDNYPGFPEGIAGDELGRQMALQAVRFGMRLAQDEVVALTRRRTSDFTVQLAGGERLIVPAVIVATGARPKNLGLPGENEFFGHGLSYCATCDAPFYKDLTVAVIGGGNSALSEALHLARFAERIYLVHRRGDFKASRVLVDRLTAEPQITLYLNHRPLAFLAGPDGKTLIGLTIEPAAGGPAVQLAVDGVFPLIGQRPQPTDFLGDLVERDEDEFIIADPTLATRTPGLWVAGDGRSNAVRQVVTAAAEGARAALAADAYLANNPHIGGRG